jgi:hypothetical protein
VQELILPIRELFLPFINKRVCVFPKPQTAIVKIMQRLFLLLLTNAFYAFTKPQNVLYYQGLFAKKINRSVRYICPRYLRLPPYPISSMNFNTFIEDTLFNTIYRVSP